MAVLMPEIILKKLIDGILIYIKQDYNKYTDKSKSILYNYFNGQVYGKFDYYQQAVDLFINRGVEHQRKLETRIFFDSDRAGIPTIHITLPNENPAKDGLGMGEGYADPVIIDGKQHEQYTRTFDTMFHVVITSDNTFEVLLIYHLLRGMLVSVFDSLELSGFMNVMIGGQDVQINSELVPKGIFFRSVTVKFEYEITVPSIISAQQIASIAFTETIVELDDI